jgi:DNA polymerase-4
MELTLNYNQPLIMHVDLNSCFAIIEQQANPLLRYKPVAVAAYNTPKGIILAASYEAKALGIKVGISVSEAKMLCPKIVIMTPDPDKYFDAHRRFKKVLLNYTSQITPKSIDEFIVDFSGSTAIRQGLALTTIGQQIKQDIHHQLGEYVTVNIGIAPNRFLAKLAAGLNKPDGMDSIVASNLRRIYSSLQLTDLPGINSRYSARLNLAGIYTPLQFLDAPMWKLKNEVFRSIVGYYWYLRLRGHEIDSVNFSRKSFGQQYALGQRTTSSSELSRLLMKLCEKAGRRLRSAEYSALGIHYWMNFEDQSYYSKRQQLPQPIYSTQDIFRHAQKLLLEKTITAKVTNIGISVFNLQPNNMLQLGLFDDTRLDKRSLALAADKINDQYGEFTLIPAIMANMQQVILKRVAFGSTSQNSK